MLLMFYATDVVLIYLMVFLARAVCSVDQNWAEELVNDVCHVFGVLLLSCHTFYWHIQICSGRQDTT